MRRVYGLSWAVAWAVSSGLCVATAGGLMRLLHLQHALLLELERQVLGE
jgi:hypothetical protein